MSEACPQIYVTGIGIVSPVGIGCESFARGLATGASVVDLPRHSDIVDLPLRVCSRLTDFKPTELIKPRKSIKLMCREVQTAVAAAHLSVEHAQLDVTQTSPARCGVVVGSEMLYGDPREIELLYRNSIVDGQFDLSRFGTRMPLDLYPLWLLKYLPNMPACHIGIFQRAWGPNNSIVSGDVSSLLAVSEAVSLMQRGWADVMIAGGTGTTIQALRVVNLAKQIFSQRTEDPATASRPFDRDRDGMAGGEGAAIFVLETAEHARARGARLLAEVAGFGRTFDRAKPYGHGQENGASAVAIRRSISAALAKAGCRADEVDHVNAHGLGTVEADRREAQAIQAELGDVPVTALKSYFGNLGAGSGAAEMAASVLGLHQGEIPPTLNYVTPDPDCPINVITGSPRKVTKSVAVVLSQSSTGQAAAVALRRVGDGREREE